MRSHFGRWGVLGLVVLMAGLGACSNKKPQKVSATAVENSASSFSFTGAPTSLKAGLVEITFTNSGKQQHEFQLIRIDGSVDTVKKFFTDLATGEGIPIPATLKDGGGVSETPAGKTATTTNIVTAGNWAYLCAVTDDTSKKSHSDLGMFGTFTVTGSTSATLPKTDATVSAKEYSFQTTGLKAGSVTVTFSNTGTQLHHFLIMPIAAGKTLADVRAALASESEPAGPPPVDFEKAQAAAVMDAGKSQVLTLELAAGRYALMCFINDRTGGPPHAVKGMLAEATIA